MVLLLFLRASVADLLIFFIDTEPQLTLRNPASGGDIAQGLRSNAIKNFVRKAARTNKLRKKSNATVTKAKRGKSWKRTGHVPIRCRRNSSPVGLEGGLQIAPATTDHSSLITYHCESGSITASLDEHAESDGAWMLL